jgi:hypothetical protein
MRVTELYESGDNAAFMRDKNRRLSAGESGGERGTRARMYCRVSCARYADAMNTYRPAWLTLPRRRRLALWRLICRLLSLRA